jgi:proline iminopeptidase
VPIERVRDVDMFFEVIGTGPPMLMMHGTGLDHAYLRPWHDALADSARIIYYDQRWNGQSARSGPADHATWHDDAVALLDRLGERKATIFGHSSGAWLALGLAGRHPERVSGLVLCGVSPAFDYVPEALARAHARNPVAAAALVQALERGVRDDEELATLWHQVLPLYFTGAPQHEVLATTRFSAPGFMYGMQSFAEFSMIAELPSLTIPILALAGRDDFITPVSQARRLAALAPNATVVELASSGHFPFVEEQRAYIDAIRAWWQR